MLGNFAWAEFDGDIVFAVFGEVGLAIALMGPWGAGEIPGVVGIAPLAVEIAARATDEDGGLARRDAFALDAVENFRSVVEFGEFHK